MDDVLHDVTDLLEVGFSEWVCVERARRAHEADARGLGELRAARRARLASVAGRLERLHEVDARIDLLRMTEVAGKEEYVRRLRDLRREVERGARRR